MRTRPKQYARILVSSIFFQENDLKYPNLAVDVNNNLIKFDNDQSFFGVQYGINDGRPKSEADRHCIILENFKNLPCITDNARYKPNQFLDSLISRRIYDLETLIKFSRKPESDDFDKLSVKLRIVNLVLTDKNRIDLKPIQNLFEKEKVSIIAKFLLTRPLVLNIINLLEIKIIKQIPSYNHKIKEEIEKVFLEIRNFYPLRLNEFKENLLDFYSNDIKILIENNDLIRLIAQDLVFLNKNKRYREDPSRFLEEKMLLKTLEEEWYNIKSTLFRSRRS